MTQRETDHLIPVIPSTPEREALVLAWRIAEAYLGWSADDPRTVAMARRLVEPGTDMASAYAAVRARAAQLEVERDLCRILLAEAYVTIGCAVESEDGLDGSVADRFHAAVRRAWPAVVDHPIVAKWLALPEEGSATQAQVEALSCSHMPGSVVHDVKAPDAFTHPASWCRHCRLWIRHPAYPAQERGSHDATPPT